MARSTAEIELVALVGEATKAIQKFSQNTQEQLDGISFKSTITSIAAGFTILENAAVPVISAIKDGFSLATDQAIEAEKAVFNLSNALRIQNDYSKEAVNNFQEFAKQLQSTTTFSSGSVLSSLALAKSFKATNEEAKKIVTVSADLAARLGIDLQDATYKVSQTLNGFVDKGLSKSIPALKALTKESLVAGNGVSVIGKEVQGTAGLLANTFGGALDQAKNSFNDIFEEFGKAIINTPELIGAIKTLGAQFGVLAVYVAKLAPQIISLTASIIDSTFAFAEFYLQVEKIGVQFNDIINGSIKYAKDIFEGFASAVWAIIEAIYTLGATAGNAQKKFESFVASLNPKNIVSNIKTELAKTDEAFDPLIKGFRDAREASKKAAEDSRKAAESFKNIGQSRSGFKIRLQELTSAEDLKKQAEERRKVIEQATKEPIKAFLELGVKGKIDKEAGVAIGAGLVQNILKGAKGAKDLLSSAAGAIGDAILPGIGGAVSDIVGILSQGPEEVKKQVQEFARAIPQLIQNIIEALPVLIETLARELPQALAKTFPFLAEKFALSLIKNMPQIVKGFADGLVEAAKQFVKELGNQIKSVGGLFGGNKDGGGGGFTVQRGVADVLTLGLNEVLGNPFGLAEGGRVPSDARFSGDRFPANLDSGEQVFSSDLSSRLEKFLNGQSLGSTQPMIVNVNVGQQQLARVMLDINRNGFRTA